MVHLVYDGTLEGFFTAVFETYERKLDAVQIFRKPELAAALFTEQLEIHTDAAKAGRVAKKIEALAGKDALSLLWKCYLSEIEGIENHMLNAIRYLLQSGKNVFSDYGDPDVLVLKQTEKKMRRERHRMTAFVRFQLGKDELYYSLIEPDFDVLPLLVSHFQGRYADQRWLIYDLRRKYGIYYDLNEVSFVQPETGTVSANASAAMLELQEEETLYQLLWKDYFKSTNIKARKNMKLHLQHVPRRYWKYLTEKY